MLAEHAEQASSRGVLEGGGGATGLLNKGGGSNRLPGLVNNKLWNFHRYRLVLLIVHEDKHHLDIIRQYMWK